jgi:hypothetical protein
LGGSGADEGVFLVVNIMPVYAVWKVSWILFFIKSGNILLQNKIVVRLDRKNRNVPYFTYLEFR